MSGPRSTYAWQQTRAQVLANSNGICPCPCHPTEARFEVENELLREIVAELIRNDGYYGGAPSLSVPASALLARLDGRDDA
mgnify:CR=1 FL=1